MTVYSAYLEDGTLVMAPDTEILSPKDNYQYRPSCGFAYSLLVFDANQCIGWISTHTLGYSDVMQWKKAHDI